MNTHKESDLSLLFARFSQSLNWNALSYIIYKSTFSIRTWLLYRSMTTTDFSCWANITSTVFLVHIWLDCGFSKSIPRFAPEFARSQRAATRFLYGSLIFKSVLSLLFLPIFAVSIKQFTPNSYSLYLATAIFIGAGVTTTLRLLFHSHFKNKQFNLVSTALMLTQMIADILLTQTITDSTLLLNSILATKLATGILIITITTIMLPLVKCQSMPPATSSGAATTKQFIHHSLVMWLSTTLKSLTERNFLVPFLTIAISPAAANIFKVANDFALLFYRTVLKTIGSSDTALLSHIEVRGDRQNLIGLAFKKLVIKIAGLCIPLLGILLVMWYVNYYYWSENVFVFQSFIIMTVGYVLETIVMPYERVLEVKRRYGYLIFSYVVYVLMIGVLVCGYLNTSIGLLHVLTFIHFVRLVSILITVAYARRDYGLAMPISYIVRISVWTGVYALLFCLFFSFIYNVTPILFPFLSSFFSILIP